MSEDDAARSPVFALLRDAARQECGRELDEDALSGIVAGVALRTGGTMPDIWACSLTEFGRMKWPDPKPLPDCVDGDDDTRGKGSGKRPGGRQKRGRPRATEDQLSVKEENKLYRDWEASGLTQREFFQNLSRDVTEGLKILDRARKRLRKPRK